MLIRHEVKKGLLGGLNTAITEILRHADESEYMVLMDGDSTYNYSSIKRLVDEYGIESIKEKSFACQMEFLYKLHLTGFIFGRIGFFSNI